MSSLTPYLPAAGGAGLGGLLGYLLARDDEDGASGAMGGLAGAGLGGLAGYYGGPHILEMLSKLKGGEQDSPPNTANADAVAATRKLNPIVGAALDPVMKRHYSAENAPRGNVGVPVKPAKVKGGNQPNERPEARAARNKFNEQKGYEKKSSALPPNGKFGLNPRTRAGLDSAADAGTSLRKLMLHPAGPIGALNGTQFATNLQKSVDYVGRQTTPGHRYDFGENVKPTPVKGGFQPNERPEARDARNGFNTYIKGAPSRAGLPEHIRHMHELSGLLSVSSMNKQSFDMSSLTPYLPAAGGAGLGGLIGYLLARDDEDGTKGLAGALAGAGLGGIGGHYLYPHLQGLFGKQEPSGLDGLNEQQLAEYFAGDDPASKLRHLAQGVGFGAKALGIATAPGMPMAPVAGLGKAMIGAGIVGEGLANTAKRGIVAPIAKQIGKYAPKQPPAVSTEQDRPF